MAKSRMPKSRTPESRTLLRCWKDAANMQQGRLKDAQRKPQGGLKAGVLPWNPQKVKNHQKVSNVLEGTKVHF